LGRERNIRKGGADATSKKEKKGDFTGPSIPKWGGAVVEYHGGKKVETKNLGKGGGGRALLGEM